MACAGEHQGCEYHKGGCCGGLTCHCDTSGNPVAPTYTGQRTCCPGDDTDFGSFDATDAAHKAAQAGFVPTGGGSPGQTGGTNKGGTPPHANTDPFASFESWVKDNPMLAIGGAFLFALVLGRR